MRQSIYTTDGAHLASRGPLDRLAALRSIMPQPAASASGVAMDSSTGLVPEFKQQIGSNMVPDAQFYWYASQGFISWQVAALMSQHWLVDKACNMPARDAVRVGYDVSLPEGTPQSDAILAEIAKQDKRYKVTQAMREFVHMGRVYGVRVAIFRVRSTDPDYYGKPFNIDGVTPGAYLGIAQVDPIWCVPELTDAALSDPAGLRFYEPEFYVIGGKRYHRSHLCVYIPHPVPDVLKPSYQYGGKSVPQLIYERVYAAERTANEAPQLAMTKRLIVHKTDGAGFFGNLTKSISRMLDFSQVRDNYGVMVIDKEADDISQHDTALTDLDATIMTQYQLVASIAEMPATKLLGTTPKGFNATGESEAEDYRITLESIQTNDLQPLLDRHHQLVMRSIIRPKFKLPEDLELETSWRPLDSPTAAEWADVNLKKAQAAAALAQIGAIDGQDVREQLRRDKDSDYFGLVDDEPIDLESLTPDDDTTQPPPVA
jgi:phage-related protein (TIGR01555 family)